MNLSEEEILRQIREIEEEKERKMRELQTQLAEVRRVEAERKREEELTKPIEVRATQLYVQHVLIESDYRHDLLALMRDTPDRRYRGGRENLIPLSEWERFAERAEALPNVVLSFAPGLRDKIKKYLHAPAWTISLDQRWVRATPSPALSQRGLPLNGAEWNHEGEFWRIPLSELVHLHEHLSGLENVVWDDDVQELLVAQLTRKASLDKIALEERNEDYAALNLNGLTLRDFQTVGSAFIEAAEGRAILGDEMGLGKTPQAIAYAVKMGFQKIVVICPATLKPNWRRQIEKFTGDQAVILSGLAPTTFDMARMIYMPPKWSIINYDIVGARSVDEEEKTRYLWAELISHSKPDLVIVDEGHYIKNTDSNRSQAVRRLDVPRIVFLTGTPVLNRPGELWPMLHLIDRNTFPAYETFLHQYTWDGKRAKNVEALRRLLRSVMIRRLKSEVKKDLPPINRIVREHELSSRAQKLYAKIEQGIYEKLAEYDAKGIGGDKQSVANILVMIGRLKQVCAIDKAEETADLARELYDQTDETEHRKVLIFTQYKAVAYRIYQHLADDGALCFVSRGDNEFITANANDRDALVQRFQSDPNVKFLVVTEKTTKEGHDITAAGHVIFNDIFWTPAAHEQAEGRAYGRESDSHGIDSYYCVTDMDGDSIEEWNMKLLRLKENVIKEVVEDHKRERVADDSVANMIIQMFRERQYTRKKRAS